MPETIRTVIMWACLGVLAMVAPVGLYLLFRDAIRLLRQSLSSRELLVFAVLAVGLSFAAQKRGLITFPRTDSEIAYLTDNGSYIETTDVSFVQTVHIDFKRVVAPATATVYVDYRQRSDTNGVWTTHTETTFAQMALPYEFQFPNATNYNWIVYTDWTPGPSVLTNGVWHAHWGLDKKLHHTFIPTKTAVRVDGEVIAPPNEVNPYRGKNAFKFFLTPYDPRTGGGTGMTIGFTSIQRKQGQQYATIDWGDGTIEQVTTTAPRHTYQMAGEYTVVIDDSISLLHASSDYVGAVGSWLYAAQHGLVEIPHLTVETMNRTCFKWCSALTRIGDMPNLKIAPINMVTYCNALQTVGNMPSCHTIDHWCFESQSLTSIGDLSSVTNVGIGSFSAAFRLGKLTMPREISGFQSNTFSGIGNRNTPDKDGFTCTIVVGNTMDSLMAFTTFPFSAPTTTKFQCADGYISYENRAWTKHPKE